MLRVPLATTSYQDTPGDHHALLAAQNYGVRRERGPFPESRMLELAGDFDAFLCGGVHSKGGQDARLTHRLQACATLRS